tara:strand:+ start:369 stop:608 length:240 start_codon:yes stop_codon:yes gene_type:complete
MTSLQTEQLLGINFDELNNVIEFSDGYQFMEVSKEFAFKNWMNMEIYAYNTDEETERLIESISDVEDFEVFGMEFVEKT